jgi:hypothetical protein
VERLNGAIQAEEGVIPLVLPAGRCGERERAWERESAGVRERESERERASVREHESERV